MLLLHCVVLCFVSIASMIYVCDGLTFAAFNIKWLTPSKYDKAIVQEILPKNCWSLDPFNLTKRIISDWHLIYNGNSRFEIAGGNEVSFNNSGTTTKILKLYDITLIQEIRGDGQNVMSRIVADLAKLTNETYGYVMSDKIGRTRYKEQYAYLYREQGSFAVHEAIQYPDTADDFEREPYMIRVKDPVLSVADFAIVGVHIKPTSAETELNKLHDVYTYVGETLGVQSVLFAGDFNADCSYLSASKFSNLAFTTDNRFTWLIDSSKDTTVSTNTHCAYDRFAITNDLKAEVVAGSVATLNYQAKFSLSYDDAKTVTDHYPISLKLS